MMDPRTPPRFRLGLAATLGAICMTGLSVQGTAMAQQSMPAYPAVDPAAAQLAPDSSATEPRTLHYTLRQLGATQSLQLRGVDGMNSLPISLSEDDEVVGATLKLRYTYSPALLDPLSHLNVSLDNRHIASLPLVQADAGQTIEREVALPADWFTDFSHLNLQLIGHYTLRCENPRDPSLWATIDNDSELILDVVRRQTPNDLGRMPRPFFDARNQKRLHLPFIFASTPDTATLEAAGTLSSWFGALADYRGAQFPVLHDTLPEQGNAVVFTGASTQFNGLALPAVTGPAVSVIDHPSGQGGKLLLIQGRNSQELKLAVQAVALGGQALTGASAAITDAGQLVPRKPYDAPRWLSRERPVSFGELAAPASMGVKGFSPDYVRVSFRLPPDLYAWRNAEVPVDLRYRYTPRPKADESALLVQLNYQALSTLPIPVADYPTTAVGRLWDDLRPRDRTLPAHAQLLLPIDNLSAESQLQFYFDYNYVSRGECKDVLIDSVQGRIDPSSTIDITGLPHFIAMPNMAAFSNGGFPFTRMADLSETAVVLPEQAGPTEHSAYLSLLGQMGASTGYPATQVQVASSAQLESLKNKDILVIAAGNVRQVLGPWAGRLPVDPGSVATPPRTNDSLWERLFGEGLGSKAMAQTLPSTGMPADASAPESPGGSALLTGFESPLSSGRSVVVVASVVPDSLRYAVHALLNAQQLRQISGSSVSVGASTIKVLEDDTTYHVGSLGTVRHTLWFLQRHPLLFSLLGALTVSILGLFMYLWFRGRANERLRLQ